MMQLQMMNVRKLTEIRHPIIYLNWELHISNSKCLVIKRGVVLLLH